MPTERKDSIIVVRGAWRWLQWRLRTLEAARAACADEALRLTRRNAELRRAAASLAEKVSQSVTETKLDPGAAPSTVHVDAPRRDLKCPCCGWRMPRVLWDAAKMDLGCPRCRMPLIWFTQT